MTTTYAPQAGSVAARVIARLESVPLNAGMGNADLAAAIDANPNAMSALLVTAMRTGLVVREKRENRTHWRLGGGSPPAPRPPDDEHDSEDDADVLAARQVRIDASAAAAPIEGLVRQSWCPVAQHAGDESSPDEPEPVPPRPPAPKPPGLDWKAPRVPVFPANAAATSAEAASVRVELEPGPITSVAEPAVATAPLELEQPAAQEPDTRFDALISTGFPDPDFLEVRDSTTPEPEPTREFRCSLWSNGSFEIFVEEVTRRPRGEGRMTLAHVLLSREHTEQLMHYLDHTVGRAE